MCFFVFFGLINFRIFLRRYFDSDYAHTVNSYFFVKYFGVGREGHNKRKS
jgi:hypothetical protein